MASRMIFVAGKGDVKMTRAHIRGGRSFTNLGYICNDFMSFHLAGNGFGEGFAGLNWNLDPEISEGGVEVFITMTYIGLT